MKKTLLRLSAIALSLAPIAAFSHPGHADESPLIHSMSHTLHYIVALVAAGLWIAQRRGRLRR